MNLTLLSVPDWLTPDGETLCDLPEWKSLEARVRRLYRAAAPVVCIAPPDALPDGDALQAVARLAENVGVEEAHLLAWQFAPTRLQAPWANEGPGASVRVRKVLIPRDVLDRNCRRAPWFFEQAEVQASLVRHPDGSVDVRLRNFTPGLPVSPRPASVALQHRASRRPFDLVDYWSVDFEHDPGPAALKTPFRHQWHAYRARRDRSLPLQSEASYRYDGAAGRRAFVKVIDVWGNETLAPVPLPLGRS